MRRVLPVNVKAIKKYRLIKGISRVELAKRIGANRQSISMYEQGRTVPCAERMRLICKELDCTPEDIVKYDYEVV
jgi:transcriptional regulator with XRE-family HTH domain